MLFDFLTWKNKNGNKRVIRFLVYIYTDLEWNLAMFTESWIMDNEIV